MMLDPSLWRVSDHALGRMMDMLIEPDQLADCLLNPDEITPSRKYVGGFNYRKGDITCGVSTDTNGRKRVMTVVWSSQELWDQDFDFAPYQDRERRDFFGAEKKVSA